MVEYHGRAPSMRDRAWAATPIALQSSHERDPVSFSRVDTEAHLEVANICNVLTVSDSPTYPDIGTS